MTIMFQKFEHSMNVVIKHRELCSQIFDCCMLLRMNRKNQDSVNNEITYTIN